MAAGPPIEELHFAEAPSVNTPIPGPNSEELLARQRAVDTSAVAYPRSVPIALDEGRGATLRDVDGNTFLDFAAGAGVLSVGHSNPYVLEAVTEQIDAITHTLDFPTDARATFLETLDEIAPGELPGRNRVTFGGPTGSDAVEASIKLATVYAVRPVFVVLTQVRPRGDRDRQAEEFIRARKFPVCPARFGDRVAYQDSDTLGLTPLETDPRGKAAQEIEQVYRYTVKVLNQLTTQPLNHEQEEESHSRAV
jgi:hypothetical protein